MTEQIQLKNVLVNWKIGEEIPRREHGQEVKNVKERFWRKRNNSDKI